MVRGWSSIPARREGQQPDEGWEGTVPRDGGAVGEGVRAGGREQPAWAERDAGDQV